jgi:hypothetical protein
MKKNQQLMHDIAMKKEKDQINKLLGDKALIGRKPNENSGTGEYQPDVFYTKRSNDFAHCTKLQPITQFAKFFCIVFLNFYFPCINISY